MPRRRSRRCRRRPDLLLSRNVTSDNQDVLSAQGDQPSCPSTQFNRGAASLHPFSTPINNVSDDNEPRTSSGEVLTVHQPEANLIDHANESCTQSSSESDLDDRSSQSEIPEAPVNDTTFDVFEGSDEDDESPELEDGFELVTLPSPPP